MTNLLRTLLRFSLYVVAIAIVIVGFHYFMNNYFKYSSKVSVSIDEFGAVGNGKVDDTDKIQAALDYVARKGGGIVDIPNGTYLINTIQSVRVPSNVAIHMGKNSILQAIPCASGQYAVIQVQDAHNVKISGGVIEGDRLNHPAVDGEWGIGIKITGSEDVVLQDIVVRKCWGDGIYMGEGNFGCVKNIILKNISTSYNRRNGLTLISGDNVQIVQSKFSNNGGTSPGDGIDIEPNNSMDILRGVSVLNAQTASNQGSGINITLSPLDDTLGSVKITVRNPVDVGSQVGLSIERAHLNGLISVIHPTWLDNTKSKFSEKKFRNELLIFKPLIPFVISQK